MRGSRTALALMALALVSAPMSTGCGEQNEAGADLACTTRNPQGEVLILQSGEDTWTEAVDGMALEQGDTVRTGAGGQVKLLFFEGSSMTIEADSEVIIKDVSLAENGKSTTVSLGHLVGSTVNRVEQLADPASRYEVETPAGVAVVRGTMFDSDVEKDGNSTIGCKEGSVLFQAGGEEVLLEKGKQSSASPGGTPSDPTPIPSYTGDLDIQNIMLCSEVTAEGNCTGRSDETFNIGETVWVYLEAHDISWHEDSGEYEAWFRITGIHVDCPSGVYMSTSQPVDFHVTGLEEPPEFLWGAVHFDLVEGRPQGYYECSLSVEDVISGDTGSAIAGLNVVEGAEE